MEVKTQGNVELWQLLGEQHTHTTLSLWQEQELSGSNCFSSLPQPPLPGTSWGMTSPQIPPFHQSIPAVQSLPELAAPRCRGSATAFQGKVLVEQLCKSLCWDTRRGGCSSVEMGFSCLHLGWNMDNVAGGGMKA